jgi:phosphate transport system ATP-binding protein
MVTPEIKIQISGLKVSYGQKPALNNLSLDIHNHEILGVIGPAQSGKSTLLKVINRTIDYIPSAKVEGSVRLDDENVLETKDVHSLRRKIGMVSPLPVGLPLSIYDNVAFAPRAAGIRDRDRLDALVERCLQQAALWDEVKDRLKTLGTKLSGGQQQRLTIARALSHEPDVLCLDEFSIAIDPVTTMRIEDVLKELKNEMTIVLVTNLVQQARRLADRTAFIWNGDLIELDQTDVIFSDDAKDQRTKDYVNGVFG